MDRNLYLPRRQLMAISFGALVVGGAGLISLFHGGTENSVVGGGERIMAGVVAQQIACSKYFPATNLTICITKDEFCLDNWPPGPPATPCTIEFP